MIQLLFFNTPSYDCGAPASNKSTLTNFLVAKPNSGANFYFDTFVKLTWRQRDENVKAATKTSDPFRCADGLSFGTALCEINHNSRSYQSEHQQRSGCSSRRFE